MRTTALPIVTIASFFTIILSSRLWAKSQPSPKTNLANVTPLLQDGDIIFIRIANALYRRVAATH